jgi:hypothetical protein
LFHAIDLGSNSIARSASSFVVKYLKWRLFKGLKRAGMTTRQQLRAGKYPGFMLTLIYDRNASKLSKITATMPLHNDPFCCE